jgi:hypothetical protein
MINAYRANLTLRQIGELWFVSYQTVGIRLQNSGVQMRPSAPPVPRAHKPSPVVIEYFREVAALEMAISRKTPAAQPGVTMTPGSGGGLLVDRRKGCAGPSRTD